MPWRIHHRGVSLITLEGLSEFAKPNMVLANEDRRNLSVPFVSQAKFYEGSLGILLKLVYDPTATVERQKADIKLLLSCGIPADAFPKARRP